MSFYKLGDNFKWFVARVSDIKDPEYLGRVRIRVLNEQTGSLGKVSKQEGIKNDELLWAWPLSGIQSASLSWKKLTEENAGLEEFDTPDWIDAVGISPTGIAVGTYVFGFYLDAFEQNIPIIFGTYHKKSVYPEPPSGDPTKNSMLQLEETENPEYFSDVSALARGEAGGGGQTLPKKLTKAKVLPATNEPKSAYAAEYPYNLTYTTKSGHAIELDDTPEHERVHIWHQSGSYEEIANDADNFTGRRVKKTVGDDFEIVDFRRDKNGNYLKDEDGNYLGGGNKNVLIKQNLTKEISGNLLQYIGQEGTVNTGNTMRLIQGQQLVVTAPGGIVLTSGSLSVAGSISAGDGASGSFQDPNGKTIYVQGGIITGIEDP